MECIWTEEIVGSQITNYLIHLVEKRTKIFSHSLLLLYDIFQKFSSFLTLPSLEFYCIFQRFRDYSLPHPTSNIVSNYLLKNQSFKLTIFGYFEIIIMKKLLIVFHHLISNIITIYQLMNQSIKLTIFGINYGWNKIINNILTETTIDKKLLE